MKCEFCGREVERKRWNQKYCSYRCKNRAKNQKNGFYYKNKYPKQPCESCGNKDLRTIHRHHVDSSNGEEGGIMYLCANCHQIFHIEEKLRNIKITTKKGVLDLLTFVR